MKRAVEDLEILDDGSRPPHLGLGLQPALESLDLLQVAPLREALLLLGAQEHVEGVRTFQAIVYGVEVPTDL